MDVVYLAGVAVITLLALAGTLSSSFDDTLTQRVALALICIAGTAETWLQVHGLPSANSRSLLMFGVALYGVGSAIKTWRYARCKF